MRPLRRSQAANFTKKPIPLNIEIKHSLPRGFKLAIKNAEALKKRLKPGEKRTLVWKITPPKEKPKTLLPPYDGLLNADVKGEPGGTVIGELSNVKTRRVASRLPVTGVKFSGQLSGILESHAKGSISGMFTGELDPAKATFNGTFEGSSNLSNGKIQTLKLHLEGCLLPTRTVDITQLVNGEAAGGVTVSIAMPTFPKQVVPKRRRM